MYNNNNIKLVCFRSAFDPNRGLFRLTIDNMLYPNPAVHLLYDDFPMHYYFVGRMLGKVNYFSFIYFPGVLYTFHSMCTSHL